MVVLLLPPWLLLFGKDLHAQERKPEEVIESVRAIETTAVRTHLGRGLLSKVLEPYDEFWNRMLEEHAVD